jgi:MFS family permease
MADWFKSTFKALSIPQYRWYFFANGISVTGTWMQRLAMSWLVYRLTGSALWLGIIDFAGWFTSFLIMPWAGIILDYGARRKILMVAQILGFLQAGILAILTIKGSVSVNWLMVMSVALGIVNAFDMPGRHSFVADIVKSKKFLANAIALNSSLFNMARLVGPALAGLLVANFGEGVCFLVNCLSFLPFAIVLGLMKVNECSNKTTDKTWLQGIFEGMRYGFKHPVILPVLMMLALASLMGMSIHMVLLPIIADRVLLGGAETLGYLTGSMGLGAAIGALWLASRENVARLIYYIPVAFGSYGFFAILLSQSANFYVSLVLTFLMGVCVVNGWSSGNTLLQTVSDKNKRSRVMSLYLMCFTGMSPLGSLLMGWSSSVLGLKPAMIIGGSCCIAGGIIYTLVVRKKSEGFEVSEISEDYR